MEVIKDDNDKALKVADKDLDQKLREWKDRKNNEMKKEAAAKAKNGVKAMEIPRPDIQLPGGSERMKTEMKNLVEKLTQDELREQRKTERRRS